MSLNIKNEETCRLAGELAHLTGETMTGAITVALRERWSARIANAARRFASKDFSQLEGAAQA